MLSHQKIENVTANLKMLSWLKIETVAVDFEHAVWPKIENDAVNFKHILWPKIENVTVILKILSGQKGLDWKCHHWKIWQTHIIRIAWNFRDQKWKSFNWLGVAALYRLL